MSLIQIYECLCDETRLRILNLIQSSELCVCHIQEILDEPQVKISKHLAYLRMRGLVASRKEANWMIYALPADPSHELSTNLACLQDCVRGSAVFQRDSAKLKQMRAKIAAASPVCCSPKKRKKAKVSAS
jgi:ArsR family transcriptional regulator